MKKPIKFIAVIVGMLVVVPVGIALANEVSEPSSVAPDGVAFAIDNSMEAIVCPNGEPLTVSDETLEAINAQEAAGMESGSELTGEALPRCADGSIPGGAGNITGVREVSSGG